MLNVQYRMHEKIMEFSNQAFYEGRLMADEEVKQHTLRDLPLYMDAIDSRIAYICDPDVPVVFVDTADREAPERSRQGSTSKENVEEALFVNRVVENFLRAGLNAEDIAVISPYSDQVDLLNQKIRAPDLETKSVDGFQGREKEVVIISLTRSNDRNEIGFLEDTRRLNVFLTRAKRKLIVVGDSSTVTHHKTYEYFFDYVKENGRIIAM